MSCHRSTIKTMAKKTKIALVAELRLKPKTSQIFIRISPEELELLDAAAQEQGLRRAEMVRQLIREEIAK